MYPNIDKQKTAYGQDNMYGSNNTSGQNNNLYGSASYNQPMYNQVAPIGYNTNTVVIKEKPKDYLCFSIFTLIACNLILGIIAVVFSVLSRNAYRDQQIEDARSKGKVAFILNVVALIIGIITWIVAVALIIWYIVVYVVFAATVVSTVNSVSG